MLNGLDDLLIACCEPEREQVRPNSLLTIVFDVCLFCVCTVFDEMAERDSNLNFWFKLCGCTSYILSSLWLVGKVNWNWFGWFLRIGWSSHMNQIQFWNVFWIKLSTVSVSLKGGLWFTFTWSSKGWKEIELFLFEILD